MKLKKFLEPFSTSDFKVYVNRPTTYQIQLNGEEDHDVIIENYGDCIVTDVDVEDNMIQIWATEE